MRPLKKYLSTTEFYTIKKGKLKYRYYFRMNFRLKSEEERNFVFNNLVIIYNTLSSAPKNYPLIILHPKAIFLNFHNFNRSA